MLSSPLVRVGALLLVAFATGCAGMGRPFRATSSRDEAKFDVARLHEKDGQLEKARELFEELYRRNPKDPAVCQRLGVVTAELGDRNASNRFFSEALAHAPNDPDILADLGYALMMREEYPEAEDVLRRAVRADANHDRAVNNLGLVVAQQGRPEEAFRVFRRVNDDAKAHANVAYVHVQRGEGKLAIEHYLKALSLDPKLEVGRHALVELAEVEERHRRSFSPEYIASRKAGLAAESVAANDAGEGSDRTATTPVQTAAAETRIPQVAESRGSQAAETRIPVLADSNPFEPPPSAESQLTAARVSANAPRSATRSSASDELAQFEKPATHPLQPSRGDADDSIQLLESVSVSNEGASSVVSATSASDHGTTAKNVEPGRVDDSNGAARTSDVVQWQQLTIDYARHGGRQQAYDVLRQVVRELVDGASFEEVIRQYSDDEFRAADGFVDWTPRNAVDQELDFALFHLPVGLIGEPVVGEKALTIVRVSGRQLKADASAQ